jgi:F-type H+-transporting ATPase subunit delta
MALRSASSRRYATALLDSVSSQGDKALEAALQDMSVFSKAVEESFDLKNSLLNPLITRAERSKVLEAVTRAMRVSAPVKRFLEHLVERDRMGDIAEIAEAFAALADTRRNRVRASVQSASPLAPDAADRLKRALERTTGKSIDLELSVDPTLLGGVRAQVGSMVFDGSIRAELERLREALTRAE